ncbi:uncharacterized protein LOC133285848 isoform X2 [Gastrolobium bilobum]|uniref:uncharacterized protein LOC133285848 isoform X2 n=1 Tax=Gastrolobium bilobum TaxID=150636 RepID=UPI002AB201F6|nr:uncharacterized protein LOC133285848 isoform X2 [Gastrolobium bilobum]
MAPLLLRFPIAAVMVLVVLSATATARPCRTFIISSYSIRNPSSNTFATITEIRSLTPLYIDRNPQEIFFDSDIGPFHQPKLAEDFSSLRDRTKDILSVALALLFGVGCGALTAATMYLVWSVFSARHGYRSAAYDDFSDEEIESPKKMGYVKIPAAEAAPPAAKDSV